MKFLYLKHDHIDMNAPLKSMTFHSTNLLKNINCAIRVHVPKNVKPIKQEDGTFLINSVKSIRQIRHDIIVLINKKWVERNDLKGILPSQIKYNLQEQGIYHKPGNGYMTEKKYKAFLETLQ